MRNTGDLACQVCGYEPSEPPWGTDGKSPSFNYCPCCGVEWGYQDASPLGIEMYRAAWLSAGAPWRDASEPRDGLTVSVRLLRVGVSPTGEDGHPGGE
jgi:hypothetical protein